ncbi:hypothetical protein COCMIDRAFT_35417 [Bipolaris oryzae ATCC 44560]|uniref:Peptide hydrolase n=1 Tax=Bipolaris oryzae ATCC 44560 TaxID=930090 RepID=W6ZAG8_COCMI|nr:uncharacterized protein COCMIDRAFT_35417 [Bipolaris oryzae ATCC 44560]EUC46980.1 hypothetical protein COCMIDRAFT_35417 [Bipolaris oryzae ATCC 44560]
MRYSIIFTALVASASASDKPAVSPALLKSRILRDNLFAGAQKLQDFANGSPNNSRSMGSPGQVATLKWLKDNLDALDYYDINSFSINGTVLSDSESSLFQYSPTAKVTAPLIIVEGGCNRTDYTAAVAGKITLIARGTCDYGIKSAYSGAAGAVGSILYNIDDKGPEDGTLLAPPRPEGPYVPTLNIIKNVSTPIVAALKCGKKISASFDVYSDIRNITSSNLIATTKSGDHNNKLIVGAHSDGVLEGPAINDVASGLVGIYEVAKGLSKYKIKNAVTFAFWTAQQSGYLPGSTHFIKNLTPAENAKICAYLNFDLLGSLNYVHQTYDGDGKAFGTPGPNGSAQIQNLFQKYFKAAGTTTIPKEYDGRSDHAPFVYAGIPVGGTSTGRDVQKTSEQATIFGGTAGVNYDPCFHLPCDTVKNLNLDAWVLHTKGVAEAVATYANSWEGVPKRTTSTAKRRVLLARDSTEKSYA